MQLTDRAFYSKPTTPEQRPAPNYLSSSAQVFDYIVRMAQAQDDNPISQLAAQFMSDQLSFDQFMQSAQQNGIPDHVIQVVLRSMGGYIAEGKSRAEVEADAVMYIETYALENNISHPQEEHEAQGGANMLAPQQQQPDQTPIQDKVQQFKDIGLNDQQIEQVMKTAQTPDGNENNSNSPPADPASEGASPTGPDQLLQNKSLQEKQAVLLSFMSFVSSLHQKWTQLYDLLNNAEHPKHIMTKEGPRTVSPEYGTKADKQHLRREIGILQTKISKAGSMWKRLIKLFGEDEMPKDELITWLAQMQSQMQTRPDPMLQPYKPKKTSQYLDNLDQLEMKVEQEISALEGENKLASDGNQPAGTAAAPMDGQRDSLSSPEVDGTGKIGQQMAPPPVSPPAGPTPDQGMAPTDIPDGVEDTRTLQEAVEDLQEDVKVVTDKIENGEAILGGENMAPVTTDTGAVPAPAPMVAADERTTVDQAAKDYFSDYYGSYGDQLTHDRIAEIVDMVDEVAQQYRIKLTTAQVGKIAAFVNHGGVDGNLGNHPKLESILDLNLINYLFKTGMIRHIDDFYQEPLLSSNLRRVAILRAPGSLRTKIAEFSKEALPKMKQPSIKGQPDNAVKVDEISDNADDKEDRLLARPGHLPMEVIDQEVNGAYLKLMIEWDPKHDAAKQSPDGLKHSVLSFVKGLESKKEFIDYGFLGQISFDEFNPKKGIATVSVRTKKPGDAPGHVKTTPKKKEGQVQPKPQGLGPITKQLLQSGLIRVANNVYIGTSSDGVEVQLGNVGREQQLEAYLQGHPTPAQW